jgi:hypothetical protein
MIRQMRRPSLEMPTPQRGCHPVNGTKQLCPSIRSAEAPRFMSRRRRGSPINTPRTTFNPPCRCVRRRYARSRSPAESHLQLLVARDASKERSSAASYPSNGGRGTRAALPAARHHVRQCRPSVDCAGEAVAGAVAADAVVDRSERLLRKCELRHDDASVLTLFVRSGDPGWIPGASSKGWVM